MESHWEQGSANEDGMKQRGKQNTEKGKQEVTTTQKMK